MAIVAERQTSGPRPRRGTGFLYLRSLLALVGLWQLVAMAIGNHVIRPQPWTVAVDLAKLLMGGEILTNAAISMTRLAVSFVLAGAIAIPLGLLMGLW